MFSSLLLGLSLTTGDVAPTQIALPYCLAGGYGQPPSVMLARNERRAVCRQPKNRAYALAPINSIG